ncbi:HAD family hydrolase [Corynebacterium sp. H130]|uniref:HAD family hydrolase n=1 Tax=Corynebacterium sp. H130 TaxID=3133444 RepID=UPI0030B02201
MSSTELSPSPGAIIFDFDGTVSLGHGPVLAYAEAIAQNADIPEFLPAINRLFQLDEVHIDDYFPRDGYDAVQSLARYYGVTDSQLEQAYQKSRTQLESTEIHGVPSLIEFLRDTSWTTVLASNSPTTGIAAALEKLGLNHSFDHVINSVGKPMGLDAVLDQFASGTDVIGVGDIWDFDLAPIHARGGTTVLMKSQFRQPRSCTPSVMVSDPADLVSTLHSLIER